MEKEIEMSGELLKFETSDISDLLKNMSDFLASIDRGTRLQNLLYRVDVNLGLMQQDLPYYESISLLLWNRVLQKVWFRQQFKIGNI